MRLAPEDRARIGAAGRAGVLSRYAMRTMQQATLDVYEELLRQPFPHRLVPDALPAPDDAG